MARVEKIADVYLKIPTIERVPANGVEKALVAKVMPPYVVPVRYWARMSLVGQNVAGVNPDTFMQYRFRLGCPMMPESQQAQEAAADVLRDTLMARYGTETVTEAMDPDDVPDIDIGIVGDSSRVNKSIANTFMEHKAHLGLPNRAVFVSDAKVIPVDSWSRSGLISIVGAVDEARLFIAGMVADSPTAITDESTFTFGSPGNSQLQDLLGEIYDHVGKFADPAELIGSGLATQLKNWLQEGYVDSSLLMDMDLTVKLNLTIQCEIFEPATARHLTLG